MRKKERNCKRVRATTKKMSTSRCLQWKRADRANNNNKRMRKPDSMHRGANDTRKCVIFIYFDFMRIFSFMWLPIFGSIQAIEYIVSSCIRCSSVVAFHCCSSKPFAFFHACPKSNGKKGELVRLSQFLFLWGGIVFPRYCFCCIGIASHVYIWLTVLLSDTIYR